MNPSSMLHSMCREVLTKADIRAVCKNRGFSDKEAESLTLFENFYLSSLGLEAAFAALSYKEVIILHLLAYKDDIVDVSFFNSIYGARTSASRYETFTQRYKEVFNKVKSSLIRRGLLIIAENVNDTQSKSKMQRWRFCFPQQFKKFLPPLFTSTKYFEGEGDFKKDIFRQVLISIAHNKEFNIPGLSRDYKFFIDNGCLVMGEKPFKTKFILEWQYACWEISLPRKDKADTKYKVSSLDAAIYAFSQLNAHQWIAPEQLTAVLEIFCGEQHADSKIMCQTGWKWGYLAEHEEDNKIYYSKITPHYLASTDTDFDRYLSVNNNNTVTVNIHKISYDTLQHLAGISHLTVHDCNLIAEPHVIKMGNAFREQQNQSLINWLKDRALSFSEVLNIIEKRWGKQIIHENLVIAQINDLSLKVEIEKTFNSQKKVRFLPQNFIAFPKKLLPDIKRAVTKSGHVIKSISAE